MEFSISTDKYAVSFKVKNTDDIKITKEAIAGVGDGLKMLSSIWPIIESLTEKGRNRFGLPTFKFPEPSSPQPPAPPVEPTKPKSEEPPPSAQITTADDILKIFATAIANSTARANAAAGEDTASNAAAETESSEDPPSSKHAYSQPIGMQFIARLFESQRAPVTPPKSTETTEGETEVPKL